LAGNLPQFLATLGVGAPAVWIFFDIFIGEYCLKGPTSMIEIQHILYQEPVDVEGGDEEFIDPLTNTFAYPYWLACCRGAMSGHNYTDTRQALPQWEPASLKQLDDLTGIHAGHARGRWMSQHLLDLGML
jgi:hypothetical protein